MKAPGFPSSVFKIWKGQGVSNIATMHPTGFPIVGSCLWQGRTWDSNSVERVAWTILLASTKILSSGSAVLLVKHFYEPC